MQLSFRVKTVLGIALIEAFFLSILIFNSVRILSSSHLDELSYRAETLASVFARAVSDAVLSYDIATLESLTKDIINSREVLRVEVYDTQSLLVFEEKADDIPKDETRVFASRPIEFNGTRYGEVNVWIDGSYLDAVVAEARNQSIRIALVEILFVAIASVALGAYLTHQLSRLQKEIQQFDNREEVPAQQIDALPKDDIGNALKAFFEFKNKWFRINQERENILHQVSQLAEDNSRKEAWLKAMTNELTDGIIAFDHQGTIHYANNPAKSMLGYDRVPLIGLSVFDLSLSELQCERLKDFMAFSPTHKTRESLTRHRNEVLNRQDGTSITSSVTLNYLRVDGQDFFVMTMAELSWRRQVEKQMHISDAIRTGILDSSISAVIAIDESDEVIEFNGAAEKLFGYKRSEMIGQKMAERIMPERFREAHRMGMKKYRETGNGPVLGQRIEILAIDREQREFPIELAITPISVDEGSIFTAVIDDISQRIKDKERLEYAKKSAEIANQEKSRFLASMSHEIRTPLNVVLGMIELLQGTEVSNNQRSFLVNAENAGRNLLDMINDVLDLSKIEAGKMEPTNSHFDPIALFEETVGLFKQRCWSKGLRLISFVGNEIPETIFSDSTYFRQIISNLIANAINYTDHGHVFVKLYLSRVHGMMHLNVAVQDTGAGLSDEAQQQLFQEYSQVHESTPKHTKGTGLGLVICRELSNLIGGDITIQSEEGIGSEFALQIPLVTEALSEIKKPLLDVDISIWSGDESCYQLLEHQLMAWGASVRQYELRQDFQSDILLIDSPSLNQEVLFASLQRMEAGGKSIPILLLIEEVLSSLSQSKPVSGVIQLPFQSSALLNDIKRLLDDLPASSSANNLQPAIEADRVSALPQMDLSDRHILLVDDSEANRLIASTFLTSVGCIVTEAEDGQDAVDKVRTSTFDLILMDMRMPVLGGVEATEIIRNEHLADDTPVVALTAHALVEIREQCLAVGMQDFLIKPIEREVLLSTVARWLNVESSPDERLRGLAPVADNSKEHEIFEVSAIEQLIEDTNREAVSHMLNVFVKECHRRDELIAQAIASENFADLEVSVHALKSSARTFGAIALSELCKEAETSCREGELESALLLSSKITEQLSLSLTELQMQLSNWWAPESESKEAE